MPYAIRIEGLERAQRSLGVQIEPALQAATQNIAKAIEDVILPYPPVTAANDPGNPTGRWYERGKGGYYRRKDGSVVKYSESENLSAKWGIKRIGRWGAQLGNIASYAPYVHAKDKQARWMARIGWVTDEAAVAVVVRSGAVRRIVAQALARAMHHGV